MTAYWIVDPGIDVICVYRRSISAPGTPVRRRFARPIELSAEAGDVLTTPLFPGLELPLTHIFQD